MRTPGAVAATLAACALALLAACSPAQRGEGMVVLTVAGDIGAPNRGPFDETADRYFAWLGARFADARGFPRSELAALPQYELQVARPDAAPPGAYEGPMLSDVLDIAQAGDGELLAYAMDGYSAAIPGDRAREGGAILALRRDGQPLGIGGQGPLMIVFPDSENADPAWYVWGLVLLSVG